MNIHKAGAYVILQMFDVSIYMPLYVVPRNERLDEKLVLKNIKVEANNAQQLFGALAKHEEGANYRIDHADVYRISNDVYKSMDESEPQEVVLGAMAFDFSMLKALISRGSKQNALTPPEIKIKSIDMGIPLGVQIFLHVPIVLVVMVVFYLFMSFGGEGVRGLSCKEIEKIPLCLYSSHEFINKGCTICLEDFEGCSRVRHLECGHVFHAECVDRWLRRNFVCPTCRKRIAVDGRKSYSRRDVHVL
ncbi:putative RING-type domain-containing protein [Ordospora pajunii]|uniref:putative RING-type domain-containing protein n=1 Tax=Ordospora pajunii TaxID=3039483 RepID=UPI0029527BC9|nr:putative RING-type domain-containing protein [Ordospora pajunii]KAH9410912.1 putative RING-type domain-containing protein [Ordospora pajunii]